jgi:hypothetical protein
MAVSFIEAYFLCQGTRWDSIYPPAISNLRLSLNFGVADGTAGQPLVSFGQILADDFPLAAL